TVGEEVELRAGEGASAAVKGSLAFIGYEVDTKTDTIPIRVGFPRDAGFRPGQYLRIRIAVETHEDAITVPSAAVVKGEGDGWVVAVVDGEKATQKPVEVGVRDGDLVEVKGEGIVDGTKVVTAGAYGLPKETKIKIAGEAKE